MCARLVDNPSRGTFACANSTRTSVAKIIQLRFATSTKLRWIRSSTARRYYSMVILCRNIIAACLCFSVEPCYNSNGSSPWSSAGRVLRNVSGPDPLVLVPVPYWPQQSISGSSLGGRLLAAHTVRGAPLFIHRAALHPILHSLCTNKAYTYIYKI